MRNKPKILQGVILAVVILVFAASAFFIIRPYIPQKENYSQYINSSAVSSTENEKAENPIDFSALKNDNQEVCAWLTVGGTEINYPVLQSGEGTPEDYYLTHDINKKESKSGAIYIQMNTANDFSNQISVIYGHNMRNNSMFGTLDYFRKSDFFEANTEITLILPDRILKYKIVSAFLHTDEHIGYVYPNGDQDAFNRFVDLCKNPTKNIKNTREFETSASDKLLVLSTCYGEDDERLLVVGKLSEEILTR